MAKKLKAFEFKSRGGRAVHYPWDEWADGSIWQVKKGEDFFCTVDSFVAGVYNKAKLIDKRVRVNPGNDDVVTFQFYDNTSE